MLAVLSICQVHLVASLTSKGGWWKETYEMGFARNFWRLPGYRPISNFKKVRPSTSFILSYANLSNLSDVILAMDIFDLTSCQYNCEARPKMAGIHLCCRS